jgi:GH25 family lysozyme M1 (1,4-beta-N-acetylmuramidase)
VSYLEGFDCAFPQGAIRWERVPAKYRFIVAQVANGVHGRDPTGHPNLAGMKKTGRICGVYLFFNEEDPEEQVKNFWEACGGEVPHFIAIDFETIGTGVTPTVRLERLRAVIRACRKYFGAIRLVVYTYPNFDLQVMGAVLAAAVDLLDDADGLWIADYGKGENVDGKTPWIVPPWKTWRMWQTSGNNSTYIEGVNGHVDHDIFNGTEAEMRAWLGLNGQGEVDTVVPAPVDFPDRDYSGDT